MSCNLKILITAVIGSIEVIHTHESASSENVGLDPNLLDLFKVHQERGGSGTVQYANHVYERCHKYEPRQNF